jgi:hypothetical protein
MKRLALFLALSAMSMAATAQGTAPNPVEDPAAPASSAPAPATAQPASKDEAAKDDVSDRNCLRETGSRLAPRPDSKGRKCVNASGRSYTKGDLDSTGAIDLEDALRRLDPAVH